MVRKIRENFFKRTSVKVSVVIFGVITSMSLGAFALDVAIDQGWVGIGDSSPDRMLHVHEDTNVVVAKFEYSGGDYAFIEFADQNTTNPANVGSYANDFRVKTSGSSRFIVRSDGDVEIMDLMGTGTSHVCVTASGELYRCN